MTRKGIRLKIEQEYGSVYRFCKDTGLASARVYSFLNGTYNGNTRELSLKIESILHKNHKKEKVVSILLHMACDVCRHKRSLCIHNMARCRNKAEAQAKAVLEVLDA